MNSSSLLLPPLSALYKLAVRSRLAAYRNGLLTTSKLGVPVISVGNITVGGTGKTPLVEFICHTLVREGRRVCVLTRGYGRNDPKNRVVVSDGRFIHATVDEAGDEALLLAQNLLGKAAVVSDSNRTAAGVWAMNELAADVFVLDDGFQHLQLARDLNVVTIDASDPWGGNRLLPYGRLREPLAGLDRADCAVITRVEPDQYVSVIAEIRKMMKGKPVFTSHMCVKGVRTLTGQATSLTSLPQPVAAFCGVGNPNSFFRQLNRDGIQLVLAEAFPDHHSYTQAELSSLSQRAVSAGARSLITTAKDAVKLHGIELQPIYVLEIEIEIDESEKFNSMIRAAINTNLRVGAQAAQ